MIARRTIKQPTPKPTIKRRVVRDQPADLPTLKARVEALQKQVAYLATVTKVFTGEDNGTSA